MFKKFWLTVGLITAVFLGSTLPFVPTAPYGGERIGFTAGIIRIYCQEPDRFFMKGPQVMLGHRPFNLELTVFEWMQGHVARVLSNGDPECPAVEPVAKTFSIAWAALGIVTIAWLALLMYQSVWAGIIAAALLAANHMWLEYSTYTMIETRTLTLILLGMVFSVRRHKSKWSPLVASVAWGLAFVHKPQLWMFFMALWLTHEFMAWKRQGVTMTAYWRRRENWTLAMGIGLSVVLGLWYYVWTSSINTESDLPWVMWMGPRTHKWYFGNFGDRVSFTFWKHLFLDWPKRAGLVLAVPVILFAGALQMNAANRSKILDRLYDDVRDAFLRALPLLPALFIYPFVFYNVVVVHEYYAHPYNVGAALVAGGVLALMIERVRLKTFALAAAMIVIVAKIGGAAHQGYKRMSTLRERIAASESGWKKQVFPEKASFVVMAGPGGGRDLLFLYLTRQRGFMWCRKNVEFAPRKFWKEQGVKYVAWAREADPKTGEITWDVYSIEEELARARKNGWSSDINDVWAGKTMTEWAALSSRIGRDVCENPADFDPRKWGQN